MLSGSSRTIQLLLFTFNLFFVVTGITLLTLGVVIKGFYKEYEPLLDDRFLSAPSLLITSGTIIFFIAFFGCCGAIKEHYCMVLTFSVLLGGIFVMELIAGMTGYVLSDETTTILNKTMEHSMTQYNSSFETTKLWDVIQQKLECCGTNNYTDWYKYLNGTLLPMSCCSTELGAIGNVSCTSMSKTLHHLPCLGELGEVISKEAVTLGGAAISVAFVQLIGIVFACKLARAIKSSSYESV